MSKFSSRAAIEDEIALNKDELRIAQADLEEVEKRLAVLKAEIVVLEGQLAALPPEGVDEELWYARHDRRQMGMKL